MRRVCVYAARGALVRVGPAERSVLFPFADIILRGSFRVAFGRQHRFFCMRAKRGSGGAKGGARVNLEAEAGVFLFWRRREFGHSFFSIGGPNGINNGVDKQQQQQQTSITHNRRVRAVVLLTVCVFFWSAPF